MLQLGKIVSMVDGAILLFGLGHVPTKCQWNYNQQGDNLFHGSRGVVFAQGRVEMMTCSSSYLYTRLVHTLSILCLKIVICKSLKVCARCVQNMMIADNGFAEYGRVSRHICTRKTPRDNKAVIGCCCSIVLGPLLG